MHLIKWWKRHRAAKQLKRAARLGELTTAITWPAMFFGSCPLCGHEWLEGEIIGAVTTAYERTPRSGAWRRSPGVRVVDALCVSRATAEGDFTVTEARREGVL
jgi:hypothetical protein